MNYINGIYRIIENIGEDSCGKIFLVHNMLSDKRENLKIFNNKFFKENAINLFSEEFIELSTIDHPNIIKINKLSNINEIDGIKSKTNKYFYVYENLEFDEILNYMSLTREEGQRVMVYICRALQYLHFRGLFYKYLNFENLIIYRKDGVVKVKLKDLSHILQYKVIAKYNSRDVNLFLSPKHLWEEKVKNSFDFYSLGVLFYYIYYKYDYKKVNVNLDYLKSNEIHKMINRLTTSNKDEVYTTIEEFIYDFSKVLRIEYGFDDKLYYEKIHFHNKLIGREKELRKVLEIAGKRIKTNDGEIGTIVYGRESVGKSRFLQELYHRFDFKGYNVLRYLPGLRQGEFSFFKEIIRKIAFNDNIDINLIKKYGSEISKLIPNLEEYWHLKNSDYSKENYSKPRIANRVFKFLQEYVSSNPLILIVHDVNSLSDYDCEIIEYIINSEKEIPLFIILGMDIEDENEKIKKIKYSNSRVRKIGLVNYSYAETQKYIFSIMGTGEEDIKFVSSIMNSTHGNPGHISATIKKLYNQGKIYVDNNRKWNFSKIDSLSNLGFGKVKKVDMSKIENLNEFEKELLNFLATCDIPVIEEIIIEALYEDPYVIKEAIEKLVFSKIIDSKFSDWGFSYFIPDENFKKSLAEKIDEEYCFLYHEKIAYFLERKYQENPKYLDDRLIFHFEKSKKYNKCIFYSMLYAEKLKKLNLKEAHSLVYYGKAMKYAIKLNRNYDIVNILTRMGDIYFEIDRIIDAKNHYFEAYRVAKSISSTEMIVNTLNKIAFINFRCLDYGKALEGLQNVYEMAIENEYFEGEITSALLLIEYYNEVDDDYNFYALIDKYYDLLFDNDEEPYFSAKFKILMGNYNYKIEKYEDACECYYSAIEILKKIDRESETSQVLNSLGKIELEYFCRYERALEFFLIAEEIQRRNNIATDIAIFKVNAGTTYFRMERFERALEAYELAVDTALKTDDKRDFFSVSVEVVRGYLFLGEFERAYSILKKLELEYFSNFNYEKMMDEYYILNIEYFLAIDNFDEARKWYDKYSYRNYMNKGKKVFEIFKLFFDNADFEFGFEIDDMFFEKMGKIFLKISSSYEYALIRFLLYKIAFKSLINNNFIRLKKIIDFDEKIIEKFDNSFFRLQRAITTVVFSSDRKDEFKKIIINYGEKKYKQHIWIAYKLLGDEYYKGNKHFESISSYFTALDILKKITYKIPEDYKLNYIILDGLKIQLKNRMLELHSKILKGKAAESILFLESEIDSIDDYFDVSEFQNLFNNQNFIQGMYSFMYSNFEYSNKTIEDVIKNLHYDNEKNIKNLLSYCIEICCADCGSIVLNDEQNGILKKFEIGDRIFDDLEFIKKNIYYENNGIMINSFYDSVYSYVLKDDIKALIYIPIYESKEHVATISEDGFLFDNEIGYMYIESKRVLNNFTKENFENCKLLINLMESFLENYRLRVLSTVDKLTSVYLRKYVEGRFINELTRARNSGNKLSVIMGDIDKFKYINDTYGHRKGDEILSKLGALFTEMMNDKGIVGRYGGEEFIFILPNIGTNKAYEISENMRIRVQNEIKLEIKKNITISFGISSYPEHGLNEEELIESADKALYYSKNTGRNKSTIWTKNISGDDYRFDKLAGILTGDSNSDATTIQSIVEIMGMLKERLEKDTKILKILSNIIDITKAESAYIVEFEDEDISNVYFKERRQLKLDKTFLPDYNIIEKYKFKTNGDYYINWDQFIESKNTDTMPNWKSLIVVPLMYNNFFKGLIVVEVPIVEKEFDFNNYNYVNVLSPLISAIF